MEKEKDVKLETVVALAAEYGIMLQRVTELIKIVKAIDETCNEKKCFGEGFTKNLDMLKQITNNTVKGFQTEFEKYFNMFKENELESQKKEG